MLEALLGGLAWAHQFADELAWVVLALFVAGAVVEFHDRERARYVVVAAWVAFAAFWFAQVYHFAFVQKSVIEGVGSVVAVPASLYVGYLLWGGRDSLFVLSRAVAGMGLVFMPFQMLPPLREWLVESVTRQTEFLMSMLGHDPAVIHGGEVVGADYHDYRNTFRFDHGGYVVTYTILIACTGIGSMAIFAGLIGAVRAPLRRKARAFAVSIPVIYALNLARNVFIGLSFGQMRMQFYPELTAQVFAFSLRRDPALVSYYWADRIIAQSLSVLALVAVTWLVVRELPEVLAVVEDVLFVVTGNEYDLGEALDVPTHETPDPAPARADD